MDERDLVARYDSIGLRLARLSRGQDIAKSCRNRSPKVFRAKPRLTKTWAHWSALEKHLWAERTHGRAVQTQKHGRYDRCFEAQNSSFTTLTRNRAISDPTQLADTIFAVGKALLTRLLDDKPGTKFRLIGIGVSGLVDDTYADPPDLADPDKTRRKAAEQAMDDLRDKFGRGTIKKGRSL